MVASRPLDATLALRLLLNPVRRTSLPWLARGLVVASVWPEGQGFSARLEAPRVPGVPVVSARWRHELEIWPFPSDPALSSLAPLVERGYRPLSHRLGRRALLRSPEDPRRVLWIRAPRVAEAAYHRLAGIHGALELAGVPVARLGRFEPEVHGAEVEWIERQADASPDLTRLGAVLARVHATPPPPGLPSRGAGAALETTVRQLGMAIHSGTAFTQWLERRLERWRLLGATPRRSARALVHGDLQPGQVAWNGAPVILDWDRAGVGDPEEDLGNLAAHLFWETGPEAAQEFAAFRAGYTGAGGATKGPLFEFYARLGLVRLLAARALNETDQSQVSAGQKRWAQWPELVASW